MSRLRATICRVKSCMQAIRPATAMVGHTPRPLSYAHTAALSAASLSATEPLG